MGKYSRELGTNLRAIGQSPRQLGTNPRQQGTNTLAGTDPGAVHVLATKVLAFDVLHVLDLYWCEWCHDTQWVEWTPLEDSFATQSAVVRCPRCTPFPIGVAERVMEFKFVLFHTEFGRPCDCPGGRCFDDPARTFERVRETVALLLRL